MNVLQVQDLRKSRAYLDTVERGGAYQITRHGRPVGYLLPPVVGDLLRLMWTAEAPEEGIEAAEALMAVWAEQGGDTGEGGP